MNEITITSIVNAPLSVVWQKWTDPTHIMNWNFASDEWHCPNAVNNFVIGGDFHYTMAAKDGSFSFDFWGTYEKIEIERVIEIKLGDGRKMHVGFEDNQGITEVIEIFEPESENTLELQKAGWQAILDNFKKYVEG